MKRSLLQIALFVLISIWLAYIYLYQRIEPVNKLEIVSIISSEIVFDQPPLYITETSRNNFTVDDRVLILSKLTTKQQTSANVLELIKIFEFNRVKYKIIEVGPTTNLKRLRLKNNSSNRSYYSLIIVDSLPVVTNEISEHCRLFKIGIVYIKPDLNGKTIVSSNENCFLDYFNLDLYRTTKAIANENVLSILENVELSFYQESESFESIIKCGRIYNLALKTRNDSSHLREIIIGVDIDRIQPSLVLDFLYYASYGRVYIGIDRYVQIDIDDVFVGRTGLRMNKSDVDELVKFQEDFLNINVFNSSEKFKFNLGFSGFYFSSGSNEENLADRRLIEKRSMFRWFEHNWNHSQPHAMNSSVVQEQALLNYRFAVDHDLPTDSFYSVSPHHSGIYPVSESLYKTWSHVFLVRASSTESYPHQKPAYLRRGFIHPTSGIMVMPRQTCGIWSHTNYVADLSNSTYSLSSRAIDTARTIVYNRVNVFMTHWTNYASDRLALDLFRHTFESILKWTRLNLVALPPVHMAQTYFELFPQDREPLWTNLCADKRHLAIWSLNSTVYCQNVPRFIILGPQKTGTTALHTFLSRHPNMRTNKMTTENFEETQFFSTQYHHGLDWYLNLFNSSQPDSIVFEKSANYFSNAKAPLRIKTFFKEEAIKLFILIIDPVQRAYSWYQHMKSHGNEIAVKYSFYEVLTLTNVSDAETSEKLKSLRNGCLDPGLYYKHTRIWLKYFSSRELIFLDGHLLRARPHLVLDRVQEIVVSSPTQKINFKKFLVFDKKKGFYCWRPNRKSRVCLGSSKGRLYERLDERSKAYLQSFYSESNFKFAKLLRNKFRDFTAPKWLNYNISALDFN